jgi:WD40 repeat protein
MAMITARSRRVVAGLTVAAWMMSVNSGLAEIRADEPPVAVSPLHRLHHSKAVTSIAFLGSPETIVTACQDKLLRVWDLKKGQNIVQFRAGSDGRVPLICAARDGETVYVALDLTIEAWTVKQNRRLWHQEFLTMDRGFIGIAVAPDSTKVCVVSRSEHILVLDARTGKETRRMDLLDHHFHCCEFSANSKRLLVSSDSGVSVMDAATLKTERVIRADGLFESAWSPDGKTIAIVSRENYLSLYDTARRVTEHKLLSTDATPLCVRFLDNDKVLTADDRGCVVEWDARQKKMLRYLKCASTEITDLAISPDGKSFAIASTSGDVYVFSAR